MASENGATVPQEASATKIAEEPKGKGKATATAEPVDTTMDEDDDDDDEDEDEVCYSNRYYLTVNIV